MGKERAGSQSGGKLSKTKAPDHAAPGLITGAAAKVQSNTLRLPPAGDNVHG
jgi:hypothetical protein